MKTLALLLLCGCASVKTNPPVLFVDETEQTAQTWVCLYREGDAKHEQLLCMSAQNFADQFGSVLNKTTDL